jgi:hypothetical protein
MPGKSDKRSDPHADRFEQARDELFSHILRCGVLQATPDHRNEWFEDTIKYLAERYTDLSERDFDDLRQLGERFCRPVIPHGDAVGATN